MSRKLRSKVKVVSHDRLRKMEAVARVAMLELSTSFRRHVNLTLRDMFVLMSTPRHDDAEWRGKLHELARDLQSVGGSFDYQDTLQGPGLAVEVQRENEEAGVAQLPARARAQELAKLIAEAGVPPCRLMLERAKNAARSPSSARIASIASGPTARMSSSSRSRSQTKNPSLSRSLRVSGGA